MDIFWFPDNVIFKSNHRTANLAESTPASIRADTYDEAPKRLQSYAGETAAGSGVVTRALAPALLPEAEYIVTDLNLPMLEHAASVFPDDPPQFLPRTPHGYYDEDLIRKELGEAGFADVSYEPLEATSSAPSPRHPAVAYCQGTPLRNEIVERDAALLERATDVATDAISDRFGAGPVKIKTLGYCSCIPMSMALPYSLVTQ